MTLMMSASSARPALTAAAAAMAAMATAALRRRRPPTTTLIRAHAQLLHAHALPRPSPSLALVRALPLFRQLSDQRPRRRPCRRRYYSYGPRRGTVRPANDAGFRSLTARCGFTGGTAGFSTANDGSGSGKPPPPLPLIPPPLSIAIVGSGPSGMYTAKYLNSALTALQLDGTCSNSDNNSDSGSSNTNDDGGGATIQHHRHRPVHHEIDVLDRLPTPFGLVRSGVAPDHPEVKNVESDFGRLFDDFGERKEKMEDKEEESGEEGAADAAAAKGGPTEKSTIAFRGNVEIIGTAAAADSASSPASSSSSSSSSSARAKAAFVTLAELRNLYDVVVLAYGCGSDNRLDLPGGDALDAGVLSAREFVGWYNGHPDHTDLSTKISAALSADPAGANVAVIGQGNVALDCARILAKGRRDLTETDIASHALPILGEEGVGKVTVLGRRGHVQGAFTIKELRELTKLDGGGGEEAEADGNSSNGGGNGGGGVKFSVREEELEMGLTDASRLELTKGPMARAKTRIDKLLREVAAKTKQEEELLYMEVEEEEEDDEEPRSTSNGSSTTTTTTTSATTAKKKEISLRFLLNPIEFRPCPTDPTKLGSVLCERTRLEGDPGRQAAVGTGATEEIPADLALVSIGYRGEALPGLEDVFDDRRGLVRNDHGKVVEEVGLYVSGWLKRGPTGIIGTNIPDAKDTVASIVRDFEAGIIFQQQPATVSPENDGGTTTMEKSDLHTSSRGRAGLDALVKSRGAKVVDWEAYQIIDGAEKDSARKRNDEQPREKITSVEDMLQLIK